MPDHGPDAPSEPDGALAADCSEGEVAAAERACPGDGVIKILLHN